MNTKRLLILGAVFALTSCGAPSNEVVVNNALKNKIIDALISNVQVTASASTKLEYPSTYSYLNTSSYVEMKRDYSLIKNEDGTTTPAVREYYFDEIVTYLQGKDGKALYEVFNTNNEVSTSPVIANNSYVTYSEYFTNPFDFIDRSDISEDLSLRTDKASLLLSYYLDLKVNVSSAKLVLNEKTHLVDSLDITVEDNTYAIILQNMTQLTGTLSTDVSVKFNYDIAPITHLTPNTNKDETIANALTSLANNYTLILSSDALAKNVALYVTDENIYLHYDANSIGVTDGDIFYKKNANKYTKYTYLSSLGSFIKDGDINDITKVLPDFSKVKAELFNKRSENVYTLAFASAKLNAELLLPNTFNVYPGQYKNTIVTLSNGNLSTISITADTASPIVLNESILNQGTTVIPNWLDTSSII